MNRISYCFFKVIFASIFLFPHNLALISLSSVNVIQHYFLFNCQTDLNILMKTLVSGNYFPTYVLNSTFDRCQSIKLFLVDYFLECLLFCCHFWKIYFWTDNDEFLFRLPLCWCHSHCLKGWRTILWLLRCGIRRLLQITTR